ncbi:MAG TPA: hypothetical protein V6D16_07740, partial [Candidatus Obscuribacterales bacterium]
LFASSGFNRTIAVAKWPKLYSACSMFNNLVFINTASLVLIDTIEILNTQSKITICQDLSDF